MITLKDIQALHPTAQITQTKTLQLFLVAYPGLTLALSFTTLIAFEAHGKWHLSTEKNSRGTTKHQHYLRELVRVDYWYSERKKLLLALKAVLADSTQP